MKIVIRDIFEEKTTEETIEVVETEKVEDVGEQIEMIYDSEKETIDEPELDDNQETDEAEEEVELVVDPEPVDKPDF